VNFINLGAVEIESD